MQRPESKSSESILLAATLLKLAGGEFGPELVKNDAITLARLAALLERWSLTDNGRIKMEPGFASFGLASLALSRAGNTELPLKPVPGSVIQLRNGSRGCMKYWLRRVKVKASRLSVPLIAEAQSRLPAAREWAAGQNPPEPVSEPLVAINKHPDKSRFAMLDEALEDSGFWALLEKNLAASGKPRTDFRVVVKSNIAMLLRRSDDGVYTDPLLVRHFFLKLAERGFTNLAMVDAQNLYGGYYLNRGVGVISAHAGYLGFYHDQPALEAKVFLADGRTASFAIRDLTDEPVEYDFGGELGRHPLGKTWVEADFRVSFSKAKTHLHEFYTVGVKNVYGALPLQDKPVEYHGKMLAERLTAAMLRDFPAHFSIVDAYLTADGFYGAAWQVRPRVTRTIIASSSIIATDAVAAMMMKYDPFESAFFTRAVMDLGLVPFRLKGEFSCFPKWDKVPRIQPFVSHNLEKYLRSPSEVSGALFTHGTDRIFPLRHPRAVKAMRIALFSTYIIRAIFDPGLLPQYLRKVRARWRILLNGGKLPVSKKHQWAREALLELSLSERERLLAILNHPNAPAAPTRETMANAEEIFWQGQAYSFPAIRPTAAFSAVELLRGIDHKMFTETELAGELKFWNQFP